MLQVTFPEIAGALESLHSTVPAAEGHGCLCGALCASSDYSIERWLEELVPEAAAGDTDTQRALRLLFADTVQALRGDQMDLQLLLPDDEVMLKERATALAQWCQGFLYGLGSTERAKDTSLPGDVDEVLRDLTQIGRATVEVDEGSEEEEQAYAEIVEYVRVGVQLVHDELADARLFGPQRTDESNRRAFEGRQFDDEEEYDRQYDAPYEPRYDEDDDDYGAAGDDDDHDDHDERGDDDRDDDADDEDDDSTPGGPAPSRLN